MSISTSQFSDLWRNHPYGTYPCDESLFKNQCAIRMGVALEKAGISTSTFDEMFPKRRCYPGLKHEPGHILAAHELAQWINANPAAFGIRKLLISTSERESIVYKTPSQPGKKGIVYINNGWGATDHIDLWDGVAMKGGLPDWLNKGNQIWFWGVTP